MNNAYRTCGADKMWYHVSLGVPSVPGVPGVLLLGAWCGTSPSAVFC